MDKIITKVCVLVLDGLGIGYQQDDINSLHKKDIGSNTLIHIHEKYSLENTFLAKLGLLDECNNTNGRLDNKYFCVCKCRLSYSGADSTLGHFAISGAQLRNVTTFLEDNIDTIQELFEEQYTVKYENGIIVLDDTIFISNNVECDPGLNMNVLGILDKTSFQQILNVGTVIRNKMDVCRVIVMGGKGLTLERVYQSVDKRERDNGVTYSGVNIPKTDIYDENYRVVHLAREDSSPKNMLSNLDSSGIPISLIGKTASLFPGLSAEYIDGAMADDVMYKVVSQMEKQERGLIFANVQELDLAGHAQDTERAYRVLKTVDRYWGKLLETMKESDVLIIVGDHGNDPEIGHSFHTREYVPLIVIGDICKELHFRSNPKLCDIGMFVSVALTGRQTETGEQLLIDD